MKKIGVVFGIVALFSAGVIGACGDDSSTTGGGDGGSKSDATTPLDGSSNTIDGSTTTDASMATDGSSSDAGSTDSGVTDTGVADTGVDAGPQPPLTNLEVWMTGGKGVSLDAGKVTMWADQSGKHHDFVQPYPLMEPTLADGGKELVFTGAEHLVTDVMQLFDTNASSLAIACVFTTTDPTNQRFLVNSGTANANGNFTNIEFGYHTADQDIGNIGLHRGNSFGVSTEGGVIQSATRYYVVLQVIGPDAGAPPANVSVRVNGVSYLTHNSAASPWFASGSYPTVGTPIEIGARVDGDFYDASFAVHQGAPGDALHAGTIAEVLIYKGGLASAADLAKLEAYLATR
jgi:hypothetical protein